MFIDDLIFHLLSTASLNMLPMFPLDDLCNSYWSPGTLFRIRITILCHIYFKYSFQTFMIALAF